MTWSVNTVAEENVSATVTVAVPAARVFAVLADPAAHSAIDGTGWVQEAADRAPLTEAGQVFRMDMYHPGHPDGNYQTANKVHVLDPLRAISWLTGYDPKGDGHLEFGGWFWRYDLAPLGPSETEVTLTYDWSAVPQSIREYLQFPPFGPEHLANSLHHLAELAAPASPAWTPGGRHLAGGRSGPLQRRCRRCGHRSGTDTRLGWTLRYPSPEKPGLMRPVRTLPLLDVTRAGSAELVVPGAPPAGITNRVGRRYPTPVAPWAGAPA